jgi:hypothetical protein
MVQLKMKTTMKKILLLAGILVLAFSCAKEQEIPENTSGEIKTVVFKASLPETKVCLGEKGEDGYPTLWQAGDVISVNGISSVALEDGDGYVGTNYAQFSVTGELTVPYYSASPASAISGYASGAATVTIPSQQAYVAGQHDPAAYIMLGSGNSPSLSFNPMMSLFKITPTAPAEGTLNITSIKLEALGTEKMSGAFTTDFSSLSGGESNYVEIEAPAGGLPFGTPVTLAIPAQNYAGGLRFVISASDGTSMAFSRTSAFNAAAGTLYPITAPAYVPSAVAITGHWAVNSSAITIRWTGSNPASDTKKPWKVHVYTDSECLTEYETYDLPASSNWKVGSALRFVIGGLAPATNYWFKVEDPTAGAMSDPVQESTKAFTVVPMPTADIAAAGLVYAEDFSEIAWCNDQIANGKGYYPASKSSFSNHSVAGADISQDEISFRANGINSAIASSRLAGWLSEGNVYIHPGYLKLGTDNSSGFVLTPTFPIEEGKMAYADVTVRFTRYQADESNDWMLCVVSNDGDKGGRQSDFAWPDINDAGLYREVSTTKTRDNTAPWETVTVSGLRLQRGDRIAFGRTKNGDKTIARVLLNEISVEVKALSASSLFAYPAEGATSSTLPFTWSGDPSHAFTAALYSDAACTAEVASFGIPAGDACWRSAQPKYVFGGLTPATTYYLKVTDTTDGVVSNIASATTEAFTVVEMPSSITSTGVALAEDFGELRWQSDMLAGAAGYVPNTTSSFSSTDVKNYVAGNSNSGEVKMTTTAPLASSRLSGWAYDSNVYYHCGYLKMGKSDGKGWILTPQFTVPGGKKAIVNVTVTAAKYNSSQEDSWGIAVLNAIEANVSGYAANFSWPEENTPDKYQTVALGTEWTTVTAEGLTILPGDRIAFGAAEGSSSSKGRVFISDIKVEVTSIENDPVRVTVRETSSSTITVEWTEGTSVEDDITKSYTAFLYDNAECSGTPVRSFSFAANASYWSTSHSPRFVFAGLSQNTTYYVKVTDGNSLMSTPVPAKTKPFTVKTMPSSISETGLAFAEDFSELCWNSDYNSDAVGIDPDSGSSFSNQTLDNSDPYESVQLCRWWSLFRQTGALPGSRLANWAWDAVGNTSCINAAKPNYGAIWVRPGYVQIGTRLADGSKYDSCLGWLLTPEFPIAAGKVATVEVTITASPSYGANKGEWALGAITQAGAAVSGNKADFSWQDDGAEGDHVRRITFNKNDGETWETVSRTLKIKAGDRIIFGPAKTNFSKPTYDNGSASDSRKPVIHLSDITVTVTAISDEGTPENISVGME